MDLRIEAEDSFKSAKVHKKLWADIAKKMKGWDVDVSADQCCNKWKAVKRAYKEAIDHNNMTGADKKTCKFYDELDTLYGTRAGTSPEFTLGTMASVDEAPDALIAPIEDDLDSDNDDEQTDKKAYKEKNQTPARKKRKKSKTATVQWLEQYSAKQEEMQKQRDSQAQNMHNDKMRRFDRLLDMLEQNK